MIRLLFIALVNVISLSAYSATPAISGGQPADANVANSGSALLQVAQAEVSNPEQAEAESGNSQIEGAVVIVQDYMKVLSENSMDGTTVHDESQLPDSKANIQESLILLLGASTDPDTKATFKNGVMLLAFYQPGVGETPVALDQMGPQGKTWQQVVEGEMLQLGTNLANLGF